MKKEIRQIRVGQRLVGIVGWEEILADIAREYVGMPDETLALELLRRVEIDNYVPQSARTAYTQALLRELRRSRGLEVEEAPVQGIRIEILGPGCSRCDQLERDVREVMNARAIAGDLAHVTDVRAIGRYGVMGAPALVINGRVVWVGSVPSHHKIEELISKALADLEREP